MIYIYFFAHSNLDILFKGALTNKNIKNLIKSGLKILCDLPPV